MRCEFRKAEFPTSCVPLIVTNESEATTSQAQDTWPYLIQPMLTTVIKPDVAYKVPPLIKRHQVYWWPWVAKRVTGRLIQPAVSNLTHTVACVDNRLEATWTRLSREVGNQCLNTKSIQKRDIRHTIYWRSITTVLHGSHLYTK